MSQVARTAGTVVETLAYDSFGAGNPSARTRFGFTGRELDPATGLMDYRARWYDPTLGRFLSEDPIGLAGGTNLYAYVDNNPLNFVDPHGTEVVTVTAACAAVGAAFLVGTACMMTPGCRTWLTKQIIRTFDDWSKPPTLCPTKGLEQGRFIADPKGEIVDTQATPAGSYDQPGGGRTDVLQGEDHGAGRSHTHDPIVNTNPKTGQRFINGQSQPGRPVSAEEVGNIQSGAATKSPPKGR